MKGFCVALACLCACAGVALADDQLPPADWTAAQPPAAESRPAASTLPSTGSIASAIANACQSPDCGCAPRPCCQTIFVSAEYLMWWVKPAPLPVPLVTTGPLTDPSPGAFGQPNTKLLFGNTNFNFGGVNGMRYTAGYWCDPEQSIGIQASFMLFEQKNAGVTIASSAAGVPTITLPSFDAQTGLPSSRFTIARADLRSGALNIDNSLRLWGYDINAASRIYNDNQLQIVGLAGFRYVDLREVMALNQFSTALSNGFGNDDVIFNGNEIKAPASLLVVDSFGTRNQFYGGQLGIKSDYTSGRWVYGLGLKVALGDTHSSVDNAGTTTLFVPGSAPQTSNTGRLVAPSNAGHYQTDSFSVIPELELKLGYQITPHWQAFVGYNFLYWNNVVRPGNQVDQHVDFRQISSSDGTYIPGFTGTAPNTQFHRSDFWAQGINFGVAFSF